jgi:hypothetical protein
VWPTCIQSFDFYRHLSLSCSTSWRLLANWSNQFWLICHWSSRSLHRAGTLAACSFCSVRTRKKQMHGLWSGWVWSQWCGLSLTRSEHIISRNFSWGVLLDWEYGSVVLCPLISHSIIHLMNHCSWSTPSTVPHASGWYYPTLVNHSISSRLPLLRPWVARGFCRFPKRLATNNTDPLWLIDLSFCCLIKIVDTLLSYLRLSFRSDISSESLCVLWGYFL